MMPNKGNLLYEYETFYEEEKMTETLGTDYFDWMEESIITLWISGFKRTEPYSNLTYGFLFQNGEKGFEDFIE